MTHGTERSRSRCRLSTRGAVSERLRLIIDFSTALRKAMRPLEEPAPIVTFSAALRNGAWLGEPPPKCACLTRERRSMAQPLARRQPLIIHAGGRPLFTTNQLSCVK